MKSKVVQTLNYRQTEILPRHIKESIEKGIKQYATGQTISLREFIDKHFTK